MLSINRTLVLGLMMLIAALGVIALKPKVITGSGLLVKLEDQVPLSFGGWRVEDGNARGIVSPDVAKMLETLYSDTLTRTYVNDAGERVMLSLAYGANQGKDLQVHKPEVCYAAQGFLIGKQNKVSLSFAQKPLPVMQLVAVQGRRSEPITYWIRSGDSVVRGWYEQFTARISASLKGVVNDGFLVRVSSISNDTDNAYAVQQRFINDMLSAIEPEYKPMFLGSTAR